MRNNRFRWITTSDYQFYLRVLKAASAYALANLALPVSTIADNYFLAHIPFESEQAGANLALAFFDNYFLFWLSLPTATEGLIGIALGEGNTQKARRIFQRLFWVSALIGALTIAAYPFARVAIDVIGEGVSAATLEAAHQYLGFRIWGTLPFLIRGAVSIWFILYGKPKLQLITALCDVAIRIAADYLFIALLGWKSGGAGLAQMIGDYASALIAFALLCRFLNWRSLGIAPLFGVSIRQVVATIRYYSQTSSHFLLFACVNAIFVKISAQFGENSVASAAILINYEVMMSYVILGVNVAIGPLISRDIGERGELLSSQELSAEQRLTGYEQANQRLRRSYRTGIVISLLLAGCFALPVLIDPGVFAVITQKPGQLEYFALYGRWLVPFMMLSSMAYAVENLFFSAAKVATIFLSALLGILIGYLPFAYTASVLGNIHLLWLSLSYFFVIRLLVMGCSLARIFKPVKFIV